MKVCLVGSSGGHLTHLYMLKPFWKDKEHLPSRFEGLPVVLLEAQISGLPCIVSDKVTQEVDFGDIIWKSIEDDPQTWADTIFSMMQRTDEQRKQYRLQHAKQIAHYDIRESVKLVENIYDCELRKKKNRE